MDSFQVPALLLWHDAVCFWKINTMNVFPPSLLELWKDSKSVSLHLQFDESFHSTVDSEICFELSIGISRDEQLEMILLYIIKQSCYQACSQTAAEKVNLNKFGDIANIKDWI